MKHFRYFVLTYAIYKDFVISYIIHKNGCTSDFDELKYVVKLDFFPIRGKLT